MRIRWAAGVDAAPVEGLREIISAGTGQTTDDDEDEDLIGRSLRDEDDDFNALGDDSVDIVDLDSLEVDEGVELGADDDRDD